jgi:hypothetical protein
MSKPLDSSARSERVDGRMKRIQGDTRGSLGARIVCSPTPIPEGTGASGRFDSAHPRNDPMYKRAGFETRISHFGALSQGDTRGHGSDDNENRRHCNPEGTPVALWKHTSHQARPGLGAHMRAPRWRCSFHRHTVSPRDNSDWTGRYTDRSRGRSHVGTEDLLGTHSGRH